MDSPLKSNDESSTSGKIKLCLVECLKKLLLYGSILIIILLLEKFIFSLLSYILYFSFLAILFQIFLHLLIFRYFLLKMIFPGSDFFISKFLQYNKGRIEADKIYEELTDLKSSLSLFFDEEKPIEELKYFNSLYKNFKRSSIVINRFWEKFNKMQEKFNELSYDQNLFYQNITNLKLILEKSEIIKFINEIITKLKKEKLVNINDLIEEEKNKIIEKKENIKKLFDENGNIYIENLLAQLTDYIGEEYKIYSPRLIRNYFKNDLFASMNQLEIEIDKFNVLERKKLITKDGKAQLEYIIIKHNLKKNPKIKKLMIICGPNGQPYQAFLMFYPFKIYLNKGIDILSWNYRGYGFSTGSVSFNNMKEDVMHIYEEIKRRKIYDKIGVLGFSLGGIAACHLAGNAKDIKLLVSDRNFSQIDYIAKSFYFGDYLLYLYKILFMQESRSVENYLNANCVKIILNDPGDDIVNEEGSLKTEISEKLCNEIICSIDSENNSIELDNLETESTYSNFESTNISINNESEYNDNQIEIEDDDFNKNLNKVNSIKKNLILNSNDKSNYNLINHKFLKNEKNNKNQKTSTILDILLSSKKGAFISSLIKISKFLNSKSSPKNIQSSVIEFIKKNITDILEDFRSAGDNLSRITEINNYKYNQNLFVEDFFNNLFIWGTYHKLDDFGCIYNSTENIEIMMENNIDLFKTFLNSEEISNYKNLEIMENINIFYNYLLLIKKNINLIAIKTNRGIIKLSDGAKYENELIKLGRGNLVSITCGHNGKISEDENKVLKYYLNKSELFLDDKEINSNFNNDNDNDSSSKSTHSNSIEIDTSFSALGKSLED